MTEHTVELSYYMVFGAIFMMSANLFLQLSVSAFRSSPRA